MKTLEQLKAQYSILSELQEHFPKNSMHKVAIIIDQKMNQILSEILKK